MALKKWDLHTIFTFITYLYNIADVQNIKQPNHKSSQTLNAFVNMTISASLFVLVQNVHLTKKLEEEEEEEGRQRQPLKESLYKYWLF